METLIEVDKSKWPELCDLYEHDWPKNAVAFCVLDTNISYPDLCKIFNFKVYCPEGNLNNGMVAISDEGDYIRVHPLNGIDTIENALATTKVIDWTRPVTVASASPEVDECFERLSVRLGLKVRGEKAFKHLLHRDSALLGNMYFPPNTYIAEPKSEHLDIIDKTWTYHGKNTIKYFEGLARNHLLFVLYSDEGNPLAWVTTDNDGHLSHLYCLEEHRRKDKEGRFAEIRFIIIVHSLYTVIEVIMSTEPLKFVPIEEWGEIKSVFKCDWPRSLSGLTLLDTEEYINRAGLDYGFKVYCPYGDIRNGIVALNIKSTYYEVVIQCPKDDTTELGQALRQTHLIDWSKSIEVPYAPPHVMACVKKVINEKNCKIDHITVTETFLLDTGSPIFDVRLNPEFSFQPLTLEHTKLVDAKWPHRYPGSEWYFELLIKANLGYGLFCKSELLAWTFVKEMGALGHLYTMEKHRRKGYGGLVVKLMCNILLENNKCVFAFCVQGNVNAGALYKKLGFISVVDVEWCTFSGSD